VPPVNRGQAADFGNGTQVARGKAADLSRVLVRLMLLVTLNQDKSDKLERPFQVGLGSCGAGGVWQQAG